MSIGVRSSSGRSHDTSYIRATLTGMAHTSSTCSTRAGDDAVPGEKESISKRWRGTHRMLTTEDGKAKCVGCGLCPTVCPANCIKLVPGEDEKGNRYPLVFEIDEFRCIFCGYCQEVCPEEAITSAGTTRTPSTAAKGSSTISSG
jgi:NADH-quinone oxidoreductase subunit I